jgi:hypothetical protein
MPTSTTRPRPRTATADEVRAFAAARTELVEDYDDALAEALLERFDAHVDHRLRQRKVWLWHDAVTVTIALGSIGLGVVFALVARHLGDVGGTLATIVAWIGIAIVNVAHARARTLR